jgi:hypothetical protein
MQTFYLDTGSPLEPDALVHVTSTHLYLDDRLVAPPSRSGRALGSPLLSLLNAPITQEELGGNVRGTQKLEL